MKISGSVGFESTPQLLAPGSTTLAKAGLSASDMSFGDVLKTMMKDVDQSLRGAEQSAIGALTGEVPLQKAVDSVVHAEQKIQLTAAVRDKIVAAYLELTRMQI
ncbi:MAG: flagellar hook-basal body complex protein FliE [Hyphomicrobiaceae bacterium]